jgi:TRAP-type C4-dicarboxylate transport system substrate-binding protein
MTRIRRSRREFVRTSAGAAAFALSARAPLVARAGPKHVLRLATLAPQGSTWMTAFGTVSREIKKQTDGEVALKFYPGGVMGDESAMVRKMRTGQLDGAAVTNVGLGDIDRQLLMLQLPLLFRSYAELDRVRELMKDKFGKLLADAGFVLAGWSDVGFVYLFSNTPIATPADLKGTKMWVWESDPVAREAMRVAGVNAVPLGVPDVLPSLQTGVVDAFQNSPYGAVALQWYTKAKYITNLKIAMAIGGSVFSERAWNELEPAHHKLLLRIAREQHEDLRERIRKDNEAAVATLRRRGLQIVEPRDFAGSWKPIARKTRENLTGPGKLFDPALVGEMLGHLG